MVEPKNNPLIDVLTSLLPDSWLTASACESGVLIRQRKLLIPAFFWTLIFGFAAGSQRTIKALRRLYERRSGESIAHSSFFGRFDPFLLNWMKIVFQQTLIVLQARCPAPKAKFLNGCWEILALDSSTFALADILQSKFASKSDKRAALKLHSIINVLDGRTETLKLSSGRASDVGRWTHIKSWICGKVLLFDLGYFCYNLFSRIEQRGGYFLTQLKAIANPLIVGENLTWRGHSIKLIGKHWHDIKEQLHRDLVDVQVEVCVKKQSRLGRRSKITKIWRMVGIKNAETGEHHWYLTNMPTEMVNARDVAKIYALRWQIELFFKTLKTHARARNLKSQNEWVMEAMLWAAMILSLINVALRQAVAEHLPENQRKRVPWLRWCEVVATFAGEILDELFGLVRAVPLWPLLCRQALDPNLRRPNAFSFLAS